MFFAETLIVQFNKKYETNKHNSKTKDTHDRQVYMPARQPRAPILNWADSPVKNYQPALPKH